jgi:type II secretory pathway pseudopilin PulG
MIVVGTITMLCTVAIPMFVRARSRSQTQACINNLRQIDDASQEWALDTFKARLWTADRQCAASQFSPTPISTAMGTSSGMAVFIFSSTSGRTFGCSGT